MLFGRLLTNSRPLIGGIDYQRAALFFLAAAVATLYGLAVLQLGNGDHRQQHADLAAPIAGQIPLGISKSPPAQPVVSGAQSQPQPKPEPKPRPQQVAAVVLDLDAVRAGDGAVPRLIAATLPEDLPVVQDVAARKASFFGAVLPLVLMVNEEIAAARERLTNLHNKSRAGETLSLADNAWLARLADKYNLETADFDELLLRVDVVSPALTLAQAAEESGWGRSRFAQEGNALFGQRTWVKGAGIVPTGRSKGQSYEVRAFTTLLESVRAYAKNLNTHGSYKELRALRAKTRQTPDPMRLATALLRYSERGPVYVKNLQAIIRANALVGFEKAKLTPQLPTQIANRPIR